MYTVAAYLRQRYTLMVYVADKLLPHGIRRLESMENHVVLYLCLCPVENGCHVLH